MIALGIWGNALQIYITIPKIIKAPEEPVAEGLSFFSSVYRVFFNTLATSHMVAMGLIAAALWGFSYHQTDFLKAKYYVEEKRNSFMNNAEVLRNHAVILAVAYMGLKFTSPIMSSLVKTTVLLHAVKMCVFSIILYVVMAVISCDTGEVVDLQGRKYVQPECSQHCGCTSLWQEFTPVCIVDQMTTYLSPCHAGCTGVEEVGGVQVFANCSCGALVSHATRGSCSINSCSGALQFHQILYTLLLSVSALAVQAHGSMLMRSVETQDQSVMLAMTGAVVAIFTFVFGHMIFVAIDGMNCVWVESGKCLLHSPRHFYLVSGVSGGMVMIACIITITMLVSLKLSKRRKKKAQESLDESYI
ncbi:solute carrier organic anion transporter family member 2B1-like [Battus philenor]|uniref:solute carrier organic anion transporter family member 2B1-like n=1 Tax=Battus philenor TaxID=42288 RepID=UPI0035D0F71D